MTGNAELNSNSEIVDFAIGEAQAVRVFMIGGLNSKTLVKDAKEDLYSRYPLKKGQAYANVVVDFRTAFFIVVDVTTATVSADIVNLDTTTVSADFQNVFTNSMGQAESYLYADLWVQPGDSVLLYSAGKTEKVKVREILWEKKVSVLTADNRLIRIRTEKLYSDKPNRSFSGIPYKVGDFVKYTVKVADQMYTEVTAIVKGINPKGMLIAFGTDIAEVDPDEVFIIE